VVDPHYAFYPTLEFGLNQAIVGGAARDAEESVLSAIGSAAAQFLDSTLKAGEVIGSTSLLSMIDHMHPLPGRVVKNPWWCKCWGAWVIRLPSNTPIA
jgi:Putative sugar-binding domain